MSKEYTLLLFDLDDTLFDYSQAWEGATRQAICTHACTKDFDVETFFHSYQSLDIELWTMRNRGEISLSELRNRRFINAMAAHGRHAGEQEVLDFQTCFQKFVLSAIQPNVTVNQMLERMHHQYEIGIITNGGSEQWNKLEKLGLQHLFPPRVVWISEEVGLLKPDRQIFELALAEFGVSANEAIFIGDSWDADVVGAIDAGLAAVWVNVHGEQPRSVHQPLAVVKTVQEIELMFMPLDNNRE